MHEMVNYSVTAHACLLCLSCEHTNCMQMVKLVNLHCTENWFKKLGK